MLNRAERRAVAFGHAFSPNRWLYTTTLPFVGIDAELDAAFLRIRFEAR